ncbi:conserved hypothetical protein [Nocardia seriolae]|nr:conserved hypothetical protein [Nocardia seriolae]
MSTMLRVAIIGAGLGGLCLAQGLHRRRVAFEVFERDPALNSRTQGYRFRLDEQGRQSLGQCLPDDLYELVRETCAVTLSGGRFIDTGMNEIVGRAVDTWSPGEVADAPEVPGDLSVNRSTLREVLLSGIADRVHFGKALTRVTEFHDRVTARFADGTTVTADVLIAADGANSTVRQQLSLPEPSETGAACTYGKIVLTPSTRAALPASLLTGTSVVFAPDHAVILDAMLFRPQPFEAHPGLTPVPDYLYFAFFGPADALGHLNRSGPEILRMIGESTADWHPGLRAAFAAADPNTVAATAVRTADTVPALPEDRITLLGDAIHAMSPAAGLGANTALRDAATLAEALGAPRTGDRSPATALRAYESRMRDYATAAVAASAAGTALLTSRA